MANNIFRCKMYLKLRINIFAHCWDKKSFITVCAKMWQGVSTQASKGLFTWREDAPANQATRGGLTRTFLSKTPRSVYMLDRVACLPGAPS